MASLVAFGVGSAQTPARISPVYAAMPDAAASATSAASDAAVAAPPSEAHPPSSAAGPSLSPAPAVVSPLNPTPVGRSIAFSPSLVPPFDARRPKGWPAPPPDDRFVIQHRLGRAFLHASLGLVGGTIWYWRSLDFNSKDWDLKWDLPSWRKKFLTTDALRFDTNDFVTNARDHSRVGGIYYLIARANGLEMPAAFAFDVGASAFWEYVIEFRELISINDLIVNAAAGPSIGEPLLQVGRFFRRGRPTLLNRTFAFIFSPFEWLTGWLDKRPWPGDDTTDEHGFTVERGHRFRLFAGGRAVNFSPGVARSDTTLGFDAEVMMLRDYGRPGRWAGWIRPGHFSHVTMNFSFGQSPRWMGSVFRTQTTIVGLYRQLLVPDGEHNQTRRGYGLLLGAGSRFDFETRTLAGGENDRLAVASLFGPQLDWTVYADQVFFRLEMAAYGDFAMVDSHAFGPETLPDPSKPLTTAIRAEGYYYGYGATALTRARLDYREWSLETEMRAHHFASFDSGNRGDSVLDGPFKDLTDQRVYGLTTLSFRPWRQSAGIAAFCEGVGRRGTAGTASRSSREVSLGAYLLVLL